MSTLSPEDEELECQRSRSLVQIHSQQSNDDGIEVTNADSDRELDANESNCSASSASKSLKKRNLSKAIGNDFDFGISKHISEDVIRKRRRTSGDSRRDTRLPPENRTNQTEKSIAAPADLESESIEVVYQEDSPDLDRLASNNASNDIEMTAANKNQRNHRDHRPLVRNAFKLCFTGNTPGQLSLGPILAEASDEEWFIFFKNCNLCTLLEIRK